MKENNNIEKNQRNDTNENINIENNNQEISTNYSNINNKEDLIASNGGKKAGLIAALVLIIAILGVVLAYVLIFGKSDDEKDDDKTASPTITPLATIEPVVTPEPTPEATIDPSLNENNTGELIVYKDKDGELCINISCAQTEAFRIKVDSKDAKIVHYDNLFVLVNDNGIKIYDVKNNITKDTSLSGIYKEYNAFVNEAKNQIIGIGFKDNDNYVGYYNVSLAKSLYYEKKYKNESSPFFYQINDKYLSFETDENAYLLSADSEKEVLSHKYTSDESTLISYWGEKVGKRYVYFLGLCPDVCIINKMYNDELKEFYNGSIEENKYSLSNDSIYMINGNIIEKYNNKGELTTKIDKYKDIKGIIDNYIMYVNDGYLYLENIDNSNENKKIMEWKEDYFLDDVMSRYYSNEELKELGENNKKDGLYIVIYYGYNDDGSGKKNENGNYGVEYCYNKGEELVIYPIKEEMGGRAKPVLYLYPKEETDVTVKFEKPELLTTTYPKYINSWNVKVSPNGDMKDEDGKYYYALYWDEKRYNETSFNEGFYVEGKDAIKFLEEKLTYIGLNDKERNEFIMYWLPIMETNKKNLVYFELTEERELGNKLIITPKPDSLLRVSIHIKKVNEKVNIKEQKLSTFKRSGFTAVEWGGMTY